MANEWSTAYIAALGDPRIIPPFFPQPRAFSGETVRQAVRLRRGGNGLRLVLSNEFGREPLVIDEVMVSAGGTTLPARRRAAAPWEIPPGQAAVSDSVPLRTRTGEELEVSVFAAGAAQPGAYLAAAQRTGEIHPGTERFASLARSSSRSGAHRGAGREHFGSRGRLGSLADDAERGTFHRRPGWRWQEQRGQ